MNTLAKINKKWKYKGERKDRWYILPIDGETVEGDCEDYSLTVLFHHECKGDWKKFLKLFITGDAKMHFVMAKSGEGRGGHAVLEYKPKGFIDNWSKKYISKSQMEKKHGHEFKKVFWFTTVFWRILKAKL
jgi:hypothetical protein